MTTAATSAITVGARKFRFTLSNEVLRHASMGPTPVSTSRNRPMGIFTLLKNGGPTVTLCPCTHSLRMGKSVPHSTAKHETSSTRLLKRKLDSRETSDSSLFSLFKCERFLMKKNRHVEKITPRKIMNQLPIDDCAKACTELTTPLRVRNVP